MVERVIDKVLIRNQLYDLVDIPGKIHKLGEMNGYPDTWWLKKPKDIFNESDEYIPWIDKGCNRRCWDISIIQGNSMKVKYDDWDICGHVSIILKLNNKIIYEDTTSKLEYAFNKAQNLIYKLESLPIELYESEKEIGRKIFFKDLPAKILRIFNSGGVIIQPDCEKEHTDNWWDEFKNPWDVEDDQLIEEYKDDGNFITNILDSRIHWFRNDRELKIKKIKNSIKI